MSAGGRFNEQAEAIRSELWSVMKKRRRGPTKTAGPHDVDLLYFEQQPQPSRQAPRSAVIVPWTSKPTGLGMLALAVFHNQICMQLRPGRNPFAIEK